MSVGGVLFIALVGPFIVVMWGICIMLCFYGFKELQRNIRGKR